MNLMSMRIKIILTPASQTTKGESNNQNERVTDRKKMNKSPQKNKDPINSPSYKKGDPITKKNTKTTSVYKNNENKQNNGRHGDADAHEKLCRWRWR